MLTTLDVISNLTKFCPEGTMFHNTIAQDILTFIKNSTKNQKNLRWRLELENYNYTVEYRTGKTNTVALRAEN